MKKFKKVFAVLLTLAMVMGLGMTAFAEGTGKEPAKGTSEDKGTITVKGVEGEGTIKVKAYPIVVAQYDNANGNFTGYSNEWGIKDIANPSQDELSNIANGKMANLADGEDALKDKALPTAVELAKQSDGSYTGSNLAVGMYLIIVEGAETYVFNPAVASINYVNEDGSLVIDSSSDLTMVESGGTWVKKSKQPDLDKKVKNETLKEETSDKHNTANIGDTLVYTVEVKNIPNYGGKYPKLNVVDTLSTGLTYVADSLTVKIDGKALTKGTDYTLNVNGQTITVDFVVNGSYTLNNYTGKTAVIEYKASVNENAKVNELGNNNDAKLNYSKNSMINDADGEKESKTYTYTFDIDGVLTGGDKENKIDTTHILNKLGEETKTITTESGEKVVKTPLKGAKFGLYTDAKATVPYKNTVIDFSKNQVESDDNGQLHMTGLAAGTYYLKEISAPSGYSVNSQIVKIEIIPSYYNDNRLKDWTVKVNDKTVAKFGIAFTMENDSEVITVTKTETTITDDSVFEGFNIYNTKLSSLPSTGGIGTTIFTIGGCAIMIIAAGLFFVSRRKSAK